MFRRSAQRVFSRTAVVLLTTDAQERAVNARRQLAELWSEQLGPIDADNAKHMERAAKVRQIMDDAKLHPSQVSRDDDSTRALGDYFDRMLLMLVPLSPGSDNAQYFERALTLAAKNGFQLSIATVQHLFARTSNYAEALTIFHILRKCHVAMTMEAYYAMVYCLQRLEEESWGKRFYEDYKTAVAEKTNEGTGSRVAETEEHDEGEPFATTSTGSDAQDGASGKGPITAAALDFIMNGCDNQLIPENKPWLGRVMFADTDFGNDSRSSEKDFDFFGSGWVERYKNGVQLPKAASSS